MNKTSKMVYISLLVAQALVLFIFERMIPVPFITPGAKLGLANIVIVIALYTLDNYKEVFLVIFLRLLLSTMFGGNLSSLMFSLFGSVFSFLIMVVIKEVFKDKVSIIGVSSAGGVFHNIGQLLVAAYIVKNIGVMLYLPVLSIAGIVTGIFVGITANFVVNHLKKLPQFRKNVKI
ncbi:Gx transporter family protein [Clostridium celatum]|uniref:Heptaprenyl diphosphate synthase component I n=1 Tax=Clostridium celatum DSM 1785 TaxID=545697 RepID=L1Q6L5_9CLOT|nr:Gx transporter family protein [Clostridium celatum]EKY23247.1 heptaprenyl diphosphate synthase component I [Clostridium celatum DSM 1785]MCE9656004.1 Gx transporter family protein [Clostridium celatum]MDU2264900.1 Gx transporter family protein [Clostridium celatum]MDU3722125.1 Gx transporter family protein [Clostridium celatum]MDU6294494.1 Gx transporter family protein [Clostridium celatum]